MHPSHRDGVELTSDAGMTRRVRRLVAVSAVALGVITALAQRSGGPVWVLVFLSVGWVLMPTLLWMSVERPRVRYLLVIPASVVTIGLAGMTVAASGSEEIGWLILTVGIASGGLFGMWFWYRWIPVPLMFDDPYGMPRIGLVGIHVGLVLVGIAMVVTSL
jgi:hypothetical protein